MAVCAVTIEPFEVSLRGGGCGGVWDFNQLGMAFGVAAAVSEVVCSRTSTDV
jgi:hypothetical protein